eukprot:1187639-Prorocentrum_minimum.AAC.9
MRASPAGNRERSPPSAGPIAHLPDDALVGRVATYGPRRHLALALVESRRPRGEPHQVDPRGGATCQPPPPVPPLRRAARQHHVRARERRLRPLLVVPVAHGRTIASAERHNPRIKPDPGPKSKIPKSARRDLGTNLNATTLHKKCSY